MSTGERSMLSAFQRALRPSSMTRPVHSCRSGASSTLSPKTLSTASIQVVDRAVRAAEDAKGLEPYDVQVLKLLYLIRYIGYVEATVENISIFMIDGLDVDKRALKDPRHESLSRLEHENYVARQGDIYSFPYRRGNKKSHRRLHGPRSTTRR